jgi:16S rRNA (adenine1518-N6/adenine1519-N6)-dimethyltransferase
MAQSKHEIQSLLAGAGTEPRHRFGQNFMIDQNLVRLVADVGLIEPAELVIEVGPGTGTLTEELLARGADLLAVEIDRDLAKMLREKFSANPRFALIEGDALAGKHALNEELLEAIRTATKTRRKVKLVANLPYNIASPLVIELLIAGVDSLIFAVQKEVGERLRARPGTDDYGPLTIVAQMLAKIEVMRKLPPAAFWPAPTVDSSLVKMTRDDRLGKKAPAFSVFVHQVLSARRKTLRKALERAQVDVEKVIAKVELDPKVRAEELAPEVFLAMFEASGGK